MLFLSFKTKDHKIVVKSKLINACSNVNVKLIMTSRWPTPIGTDIPPYFTRTKLANNFAKCSYRI